MGIYIELSGGLGNQLFQYGAAILYQRVMKEEVFLVAPAAWAHSGRDYRNDLYRRIPSVDTRPPHAKVWCLLAYKEWDPEQFDGCSFDLLIIGYFQHLPSIQPVLPQILQDLTDYLAPYREFLRAKYSLRDLSSVAFMHVRRGDYLAIADGQLHFVQGPEYYEAARTKFPKKRWLVLSNDIAWCAGQSVFADCTIADEPDELYGLALMSLCHGGAIIGNSTYSWWGAMLGSEQAKATIVYPSRWIADVEPDLCPSRWIRL